MSAIQTTLVSAEHGYDDFDVSGLQCVERVCVPHNIRRGDVFNVYCADSVKLGATWKGSVKQSLTEFAETHERYQELVAADTAAPRPGF